MRLTPPNHGAKPRRPSAEGRTTVPGYLNPQQQKSYRGDRKGFGIASKSKNLPDWNARDADIDMAQMGVTTSNVTVPHAPMGNQASAFKPNQKLFSNP